MVSDFRQLIDAYQIHHHSKRCRLPNGKYRFDYPQEMAGHTRIRGHNYHFSRDLEEGNIVPHNPSLLASFRAHHCLKVIHSKQCLGYILKYYAKNSDAGRISLQNVLYEGYSITRVNKLHYCDVTRISSASECFVGICGYCDTTWNWLFMFLKFISLDRKSYWHLGPVTLWKRLISQASWKTFRSPDRQFIWPIDLCRLSLSVFCLCQSSLL
jgi:hypothetical protein